MRRLSTPVRAPRTAMDLEQHLEGMVTFKLSRDDGYTALALLTDRQYTLYGIRQTPDSLYFSIYLDDFKPIQRLLRDRHLRFAICGKRGLPFVISRWKRRKGLWAGLICCVIAGHMLLSFLWDYEVTGNERYSDAQIIALVQQYGLWPGTYLPHVAYEALEHEIELDHPELTWVQLEHKGTTLYISVKERLAGTADLAAAGSIVAKADGRITELLVYTGTAMTQVGDTVTAGQVLVGGWDYPQRIRDDTGIFADAGEPYALRAKCTVRGEMTYRAIGTCAMEEIWLVHTGASSVSRRIYWGEHRLCSIGPDTSPYPYSEDVTERKSLYQWGRWQCPIVLCTTVYQEQTAVNRSFTPEEAYHTAVERARRQLEQRMPVDGRLVRESNAMHRSTQDGVIQAEVLWIVDAPIGELRMVPLPE